MRNKPFKLMAFVLAIVMILGACGSKDVQKENTVTNSPTPTTEVISSTPTPTTKPSPTLTPTPTPVITDPEAWEDLSLRDRYEGEFRIGVALPYSVISKDIYMQTVEEQFNSFTFENEMKPDALLNKTETQNGYPATNTEPVLRFTGITKGLDWAQEHGFGVRGHTLCWYSQTPRWFFTVDYQDKSELCSREVMLNRLESYIKQVMTYCQTNYPGLIYAWDVVNEAVDNGTGDENLIRKGGNLWYETIGPDFIYYAFQYARKYSDGTALLFYNDYGCANKRVNIVNILQKVKDAGYIDGIGMQCHLNSGDRMTTAVYETAKYFTECGYKVEITELDIACNLKGDLGDLSQAMKYKTLFRLVEQGKKNGEIDIDSITIWGLYDTISWKATDRPLIFRIGTGMVLERKLSWYGAMQHPGIPENEK